MVEACFVFGDGIYLFICLEVFFGLLFWLFIISSKYMTHCRIDRWCWGLGNRVIFVGECSFWMSMWVIQEGYSWVLVIHMVFLM